MERERMKHGASASYYCTDGEIALRDGEIVIYVVVNYMILKYVVKFSGPWS